MILSIRNSVLGKAFSFLMIFVFILTLNPSGTFALTGGPAQPEFNSFTPIGTSDMVDLASGDFSYNIPLMDVGGFPINLAYNSGITMDQEASWVGLGWDLSIGQINRQMRGLPDDFDGDEMLYENNIKDNYTVGGTFQFSPELLGFNPEKFKKLKNVVETDGGEEEVSVLKFGLSAKYNSYNGFSMSPSAGITFDIANVGKVGMNAESTPDGLVLSPHLSLSHKVKKGKLQDRNLGGGFGLTFNSRQGLVSLNMSTSIGPDKGISANKHKRVSGNLGSSKSFLPNTYTPTVESGMTTVSGTFNASMSTTIKGVKAEAEITGFASSQVLAVKRKVMKGYGYENTYNDLDKTGVLDFNREKDGVFTVNSTNLPITNYTYDLYSVSGQGVSGMFHPHRSQVGYVYDNESISGGGGVSGGVEFGTGDLVDIGADIEIDGTVSRSGLWSNNNNALSKFEKYEGGSPNYEEVYFKNVGDLSADRDYHIYGDDSGSKLKGYKPTTLKLGGFAYSRTLENVYVSKGTDVDYVVSTSEIVRDDRVKRNQTIQKINNYESHIVANIIPNEYAEPHHTAGFIITRDDGARYNYGKSLYNTAKKEVTFSIGEEVGSMFSGDDIDADSYKGLVSYGEGDNSLDNTKGNHYYNSITTPGYAHTYLLTSILSSDYSDIDLEEGPSEGDLGSYTLFDYDRSVVPAFNDNLYKWRVPYELNKANFNEGLKTDPTDDKASYVYGKKELQYVRKIETKTHVALFYISNRRDAYGVNGENGGFGSGSKMYKLDKVVLYSRGEYYNTGVVYGNDEFGNIVLSGDEVPVPIKTTHFEYSYDLCPDVPNNEPGTDAYNPSNNGGKLTLKKVYFTYRNSNMGKYSPYSFVYGDSDHDPTTTEVLNAPYNLKGYDVWGSYKENNASEVLNSHLVPTVQLSAPEFNYTEQSAITDEYAAMWTITDISLPSGGKIEIDYESDDYQYVQDKRAMRMFKLSGAGDVENPMVPNGQDNFKFLPLPDDNFDDQKKDEALLYKGAHDANYLYFELDEKDQNPSFTVEEFRQKYLSEIYENQKNLLQFRFLLNMTPTGGIKTNGWKDSPFDYVSGYCELGELDEHTIFEGPDLKKYGSVKMKKVNLEGGIFSEVSDVEGAIEVSPISKAGWNYSRKYLSRYVYGLGEIGDGTPAGAALEALYQSLENLTEVLTGPNALLKSKKIAKRFVPEKSWIRLGDPTYSKKGGGSRVREIAMTDEWAKMAQTGAEIDPILDQKYGQQYSYTLTDNTSSGVATFEPAGAKDNPLVQPVFVEVNRILAPDDNNYMETPFGESFYPNPKVTYSRVSVKNLERINEDNGAVLKKHATGNVVTEFFTTKDYPTITDQTRLIAEQDHNPIIAKIFSINMVKHLTLSQGYVVHLNDMDGKMKSQRVYAEGQDDYISGVDYVYDGHTVSNPESLELGENFADHLVNKGKIDNSVWTMNEEGVVALQSLGVEQQIINDFREMKSSTLIGGVDGQTNTFTLGLIVLPVPTFFPKFARHKDKLNISTTTKVINTYGILKEVVAHDAGSSVSTRNLIWDETTGEVLLTETVNEYGDKYYSLNMPAHWNYKGMGQSSFNSGIELTVGVSDNPDYNLRLLGAGQAKDFFFPGDEVIFTIITDDAITREYAWINNVADSGDDFELINADGEVIAIPASGIKRVKVIRSGKRNLQGTSMGSVVLQGNPFSFFTVADGNFVFNPGQLNVDETAEVVDDDHWTKKKIVNAGAVEFNDLWSLQCECIFDPVNDTYNAYRYNTKGVWRAKRSHLYLTGRVQNIDPRKDGFYRNFSSFYQKGASGWYIPEDVASKWTFTSEVTEFSPFGFELENKDALGRKSAAQYGYNNSFPLAVGANSAYQEMGFDGFEDYNFDGCDENEHFGFRESESTNPNVELTNVKSHTGRFSLKVTGGEKSERLFRIECNDASGETDPDAGDF